jgi:ubiquinone/menaquinone biosynthesis C-methylase UbiE
MPDVYNTITTADPSMVQRISSVLEIRAADPQQKTMLKSYLAEIDFPLNARVLEVGCGTGAVTRQLATWPNVAQVIGIDPSPVFVAKARELGTHLDTLSFQEGDAYKLALDDNSMDAVIFHTTLCHLSRPHDALKEAYRVTCPGGWLAVFDGDYASITFGTGDFDPLQMCADAFRAYFIFDSWLARRTPMLAKTAGFTVVSYRSHGYTESSSPEYMLTIVDRGADALAAAGQIGSPLAEALKAEARRRVEAHRFFGHINYTSLIARKPPVI